MRPLFEKIIQEIRSTILQHQKQSPSEKIEEICISGAGESIKGFDQYLANQLNFPVRRLDAKRFDAGLDASWAGVLGLAFLPDSPFNLTSEEDSLLPRFRALAGIFKRMTLLGLALFFILAAVGGVSLSAKKGILAGRLKQFAELNQANQTMIQIQNLKMSNDQAKNLLRANTSPLFYHGAILRELSHLVPDGVVLNEAAFESTPTAAMTLSGKVLPSAGNPDSVISGFLGQLNQSPFFDHSGLQSRNGKKDEKDTLFVAQADLVKGEDFHEF